MTVGTITFGPGVEGTNLIRRFRYDRHGRRHEIEPRYIRPLRQRLTFAARQAVAETKAAGYGAVVIEGTKIRIKGT